MTGIDGFRGRASDRRDEMASRACTLVRLGAVLSLALYVFLVSVAWIGNVAAGHEGILNAKDGPDGLIITEISPDSPVDRAGLQPGDRILAVNGIPMPQDRGEAVHQQLHERRAGKPMVLRVQRSSQGATASIEDVRVVAVSQLAIPSVFLDLLSASIVGLLVMGVATLVAIARPSDLAARLLLVFATGFVSAAVLNIMHWALLTAWLGSLVDRLGVIALLLACAALFHLFLAFPVPKPFLSRLRAFGPAPLRRAGGATFLIYAFALAIPAGLLLGIVHDFSLVLPVLLVLLLGSLITLIRSFWHAKSPLAHAQLNWVTWGLAVFVIAQILGVTLPSAELFRIQAIPPAPFTAAFAVFPLSIGFAVLRYHLWDVDILINRTLVYGALSLLLVGVYLGGILLLQPVFQALTGAKSDLATVGSTLAMAVLFQPMRRRVQALIDRWFYRRKYDAAKVLFDFSATVRDEVDLDRLTSELLRVVDETMQPSHVSLWLHVPDVPGQQRQPADIAAAAYREMQP